MAADMAEAELEPQFLPFCSVLDDGRKTSLKKIQKQMAEGSFYPGEGHKRLVLSRELSPDGYLESADLLFIGGTRRSEPTPKELFVQKVTLRGNKDDMSIANVAQLKLQGVARCQNTSSIYVYGGQDLAWMKSSSDFFCLKPWRNGYRAEKLGPTGAIPSDRFGHSFVTLSDEKLFCFGGLRMDLRQSNYSVTNFFRQVPCDKYIYIFDVPNVHFNVLAPLPECIAFHSTSVLCKGGSSAVQVFLVGGVIKGSERNEFERLPLSKVLCVEFANNVFDHYVLTTVNFDVFDCFMSFHDSVIVGQNLLVFGGNVSPTATGHASKGSSTLFKLDLQQGKVAITNAGYAQSDFTSRGHSMTVLDDCTVLICGGLQKALFLYTSKKMSPAPCNLDDRCKISDSDVISPIPWVQCETCLKWIHWFCANIKREPRTFNCSDCLKFRNEARKVSKTKR